MQIISDSSALVENFKYANWSSLVSLLLSAAVNPKKKNSSSSRWSGCIYLRSLRTTTNPDLILRKGPSFPVRVTWSLHGGAASGAAGKHSPCGGKQRQGSTRTQLDSPCSAAALRMTAPKVRCLSLSFWWRPRRRDRHLLPCQGTSPGEGDLETLPGFSVRHL